MHWLSSLQGSLIPTCVGSVQVADFCSFGLMIPMGLYAVCVCVCVKKMRANAMVIVAKGS